MNWAIEELADITMVRTANDHTNITVVEAKSDSQTDMMAAIEYVNNHPYSRYALSSTSP